MSFGGTVDRRRTAPYCPVVRAMTPELEESARQFLRHVATGVVFWLVAIVGGVLTVASIALPGFVVPTWLAVAVFLAGLVYGYINAFRAFHAQRMATQP